MMGTLLSDLECRLRALEKCQSGDFHMMVDRIEMLAQEVEDIKRASRVHESLERLAGRIVDATTPPAKPKKKAKRSRKPKRRGR